MDNINLKDIPAVPDQDCYEPARPLSDYELNRSYYFLFWNREQTRRSIPDEQLPGLFHIVKGKVVDKGAGTDNEVVNQLVVQFPGLNETMRYGTDYRIGAYQTVWKKLTTFYRTGKIGTAGTSGGLTGKAR